MFAGTASHKWSLKLSDLFFQLKKSRVISALLIANVVVDIEEVSSPCQPPQNEATFQEGCVWGTPAQRAEAPKTASRALGQAWGRMHALGTAGSGGPIATCKAVVFCRELLLWWNNFCFFVEQSLLCFCR